MYVADDHRIDKPDVPQSFFGMIVVEFVIELDVYIDFVRVECNYSIPKELHGAGVN